MAKINVPAYVEDGVSLLYTDFQRILDARKTTKLEYLQGLKAGQAVATKNEAEKLFVYTNEHRHPSDAVLAALAADWKLGPLGYGTLVAKAEWELWRGERAGWANRRGQPLVEILGKRAESKDIEGFVNERAETVSERIKRLGADFRLNFGTYRDAYGVSEAVLKTPSLFMGEIVSVDGAPKNEFREVPGADVSRDAKTEALSEIKTAALKLVAGPVLRAFYDVRWGLPAFPPSFKGLLDEQAKGTGFHLLRLDTSRKESNKTKLVMVQVGLIFKSKGDKDGKGAKVGMVNRLGASKRAPGRVSEGDSFLFSFSPDPALPFKRQVEDFIKKSIRGSIPACTITPFATMLNEVNFTADEDAFTAHKERPSYLFFLAEVNVGDSFPSDVALRADASKKPHPDTTFLADFDQVGFEHFKNHGDRVALLALRNPERPWISYGSATLFNLRHHENPPIFHDEWPSLVRPDSP